MLRAFLTACVAFKRGVKVIVLAPDEDVAFQFKLARPTNLLVGETDGCPIEVFDFGYSPTELSFADIDGRILIHKTTAGAPAALGALDRDLVFVTGLISAKTSASHAEQLGAVQYIPSDPLGDEGIACTEYMRGESALDQARGPVVASGAAQKFLRNEVLTFPRSDLEICLREAATRFAMEVRVGAAPSSRGSISERLSVQTMAGRLASCINNLINYGAV